VGTGIPNPIRYMMHVAVTLLLLLSVRTSGFNLLATRPTSLSSAAIARHTTSPRLASTGESHQDEVVTWIEELDGTMCGVKPHRELSMNILQVSRRDFFGGALLAAGVYCSTGTVASAYTVTQAEPDEKETYAEAQKGKGPLRVLWVGPGDLKGVSKNIFKAGNEVVALDLRKPDGKDLKAAKQYATEHGYQLRFEKGDATKLKFEDGTFDVVVSSMFLCQDFNPEVVVSEIRRVLKPGGRFGFYEHVEDIGNVIVDKVFGDSSVIRFEAYPEKVNVVAGVVKKV